jgi:hypothetical protein
MEEDCWTPGTKKAALKNGFQYAVDRGPGQQLGLNALALVTCYWRYVPRYTVTHNASDSDTDE